MAKREEDSMFGQAMEDYDAGVEQATPTMSQYVDTLYNKAISGQLLTEPTTEEEPQQ